MLLLTLLTVLIFWSLKACPVTTPFSGSNKVKVVTSSGQTEFGFSIKQPAPVITNIDQLASGVYFVSVNNNGILQTQKLVVIR